MATNGICNLCLQNKELIGKSRIIPSFMYKGMEDELNRFRAQHFNGATTKTWMPQTGIFDKFILCANCDNVTLGNLERYAYQVLRGGIPLTYENRMGPDGIRSVFVQGLDYKKYKLFALSILWRAHISTNPFFKQVDIPEEAEILRKYILTDTVPPESVFKTMIFVMMEDPKSLMKLVANPRFYEDKSNGEKFCGFMINGYLYVINLGDVKSTFFKKVYLKEDGTIEMPMFLPPHSWEFLMAYFGKSIFGMTEQQR